MRKSEQAAILITAAAVCIGIGFLSAGRVPSDSYTITTKHSDEVWFSENATPVFAPGSPDAPNDSISGTPEAPSPTPRGRININTATSVELQDLPGIGPALAERIITYREEQGAFDAIEELTKVSGIGEKIFEALKELVTVS